ncbi:hypothetical protein [Streptomyces sp. NBC_00078]|uniref:hypothetical protein n=1 Tax=unclassified Streptomyces TaxID=2593676 RepID=UPI00224D2532|nr:hypothetical protein [Streptomyces sp. NBC_00078]MCX5425775.1 hypothetical protein [Streptomyces sp. NBC_00078]
MSYGSMMLLSLGLVALVSLCVGSLGIYAFTGNRVPGRLLRRIVRNPRLWGLGLLVQVASLLTYSGDLLVLGVVCTVCGHVVKPAGHKRRAAVRQ